MREVITRRAFLVALVWLAWHAQGGQSPTAEEIRKAMPAGVRVERVERVAAGLEITGEGDSVNHVTDGLEKMRKLVGNRVALKGMRARSLGPPDARKMEFTFLIRDK